MEISATAFHEAGHAVVCYLNGEPVGTVSIIPVGDLGGHFTSGERPEKKVTLPRIDYEALAECMLAGEAAEVISGVDSAPDWENSGRTDWFQAHAYLFKRLGLPFNDKRPAVEEIPEAFQLLGEFETELVQLYFDFLFRRASLRLKHHWSLVEAVAIALTERKELNAEEFSDVVSKALKVCCGCGCNLGLNPVTCEDCKAQFCPECAAEMNDGLCGPCSYWGV
jgi:hypothetical protein